ncbi:MAG: FAD-dependent oxidoreductase [Bacillota bacterium]
MSAMLKGRAVVMGGSVSGLTAARVLADFFEEVVIVEKDSLPDGPEVRQGTPQARQIHILLARGGQILDGLFPGLIQDLQEGGAVPLDSGAGVWYHNGTWRRRIQSGITTYLQTRPFLEWKVRTHVSRLPNVRILSQRAVVGLTWNEEKSVVTGVELADGQRLSAELVVDASGRGSRVPQWLEQAGYPAVPVSSLKIDIGYVTRAYRLPSNFRAWPWILVNDGIAQGRLAGLSPVEGGQWLLILQGYGDARPPADEDGLHAFLRSLPVPELYETIRSAEPLSPIYPYRYPSYQRRHFERVARHPEGLVVVGDAACSFNPIYGQGMTTGMLGAMALGDSLRSGGTRLTGLAGRFHRRLAPILDVSWQMATLEDYGILGVPEGEPAGTGAKLWYTERAHRLTGLDDDVMLRFLKVMHMLEQPKALFNPRTVWRVATAGGRSTTGRGMNVATRPDGQLSDPDHPSDRPAI